jgi:hypothetical protein
MPGRHGRVCYIKDHCRCDVCRQAERDYRLAHRARARGLELLPDASDEPQVTRDAEDSSPPGPVLTAVLAELDGLPATKSRPGLAASAIRMAEIIDSKPLSTTAPSAQRRLQAALSELRNASWVARRGGWLR